MVVLVQGESTETTAHSHLSIQSTLTQLVKQQQQQQQQQQWWQRGSGGASRGLTLKWTAFRSLELRSGQTRTVPCACCETLYQRLPP